MVKLSNANNTCSYYFHLLTHDLNNAALNCFIKLSYNHALCCSKHSTQELPVTCDFHTVSEIR